LVGAKSHDFIAHGLYSPGNGSLADSAQFNDLPRTTGAAGEQVANGDVAVGIHGELIRE
jgi:hypothetical protein